MPALFWCVGDKAGLSSRSRVHPSHAGALLGLGILPFYSTAGQPDLKDNCVFGKTLIFFSGYTIALLPVKGWRRWLCWWWVTCEAMAPVAARVCVAVSLPEASLSIPIINHISSSLGISGLFIFCHLVIRILHITPTVMSWLCGEKVSWDTFGKNSCSKWMN